MSSGSAWDWRPDKAAWYGRLQRQIGGWEPDLSLGLASEAIKRELAQAADRNEPWLSHPCLGAVTFREGATKAQRDSQLAFWLAVHAPGYADRITVQRPTALWSPAGSIEVEAGTHDLRRLVDQVLVGAWPFAIAIDVWCHSVGFALPDSWAAFEVRAEDCRRLQAELAGSIEVLDLAARALSSCLSWTVDVARVLVPLRSEGNPFFRSGSNPDIAGLVFADQFGGFVQLMEALVHESAHLHLMVAEAEAPLVDPQHDGRYSSPLRPEPRPLRGILLAYHAIAYICAFYEDVISAGLAQGRICRAELPGMRDKMAAAGEVLASNRRHLTGPGREFLERTAAVAA